MYEAKIKVRNSSQRGKERILVQDLGLGPHLMSLAPDNLHASRQASIFGVQREAFFA